jgi:hypothetical protein
VEIPDPEVSVSVQQNVFGFEIAVRETTGMQEPHHKGNTGDDFRDSNLSAQTGGGDEMDSQRSPICVVGVDVYLTAAHFKDERVFQCFENGRVQPNRLSELRIFRKSVRAIGFDSESIENSTIAAAVEVFNRSN